MRGHVRASSEPGRDRVLVVDDSSQNRLVACGHLEAAGYEVASVGSGEEALDYLGTHVIDLVVLDILMPGLGGFETCRRIRASPTLADTPVLFLTALGDREVTAPALEAGGDDLLPKPFHRAELLLRARALIRLRRTTAQLRESMRELAEQNERLRRIEHDKRRVAALIVHDLRGPLSGILGNAELLQEAELDGDLGEAASDIVLAANQLDRATHDLLDVSRAEDVALAPRPEPFDLEALVVEVASSLRGFARSCEVKLDIALATERVLADRELVRRVLQNLVHNAIKHAPRGTQVRVEAERDSDAVVLRVSDDGRGVPPGAIETIFDAYVKLDDHATGNYGLGLAFCRLAVQAHGGTIWAENRVPRGAAFCVRLPQPAAESR
jgi:two-component system sensor histidine kinase/response regulator